MAEERYKTVRVRKPFYSLSDGVFAMSDAAFDLGDADLMRLMSEIRMKLNELNKTLDEKYIWD